jgi:hypothetical protein
MAELRAQTAELTAENAAYAGRASCTRRTASCTSWHVSCNAHLSYAAVRISICRAAHRQRPCQLALLGLVERAQHARATQQCGGRQHTPVSTSCTTQVCGFARRTDGAACKPRGGKFEA